MSESVKNKNDQFAKLNNGTNYVSYNNGALYEMDKNDKGVKFKIKRIGRLDSNVANHVVSLYINAQTRVPLLMDPSKDLLELKEREVHYKGAKKENIKMYYYNKNAYLDLLTLESQFEELGLDLQQVFNQCLQK